MRLHGRRPRQRAAAMLLGLFFLGEMLPEVALAQNYGTSRRVARRTSRRTATRHDAYYGGTSTAVVAAVPAGAQTVTALPAGCVASAVSGITYQQCGGVRYRPYYQGESLVYVAE
ncbi:hypothetical protein [Corallococcus carmarthensis]|uniref:Uncharacterized protein n=1 Tax=Corallococcus carmarthensis TaxID=2316728 RepID=A0A3A8KNS0_9BACT|nr:hypothetical protein [Corallococcus carmarthensis]NOK17254.1 hypothetical protein [Corallococcus carmarthensis]RKH05805.1 hypothetical protein D7X32_06850 [Corallococcus carmarthensis]